MAFWSALVIGDEAIERTKSESPAVKESPEPIHIDFVEKPRFIFGLPPNCFKDASVGGWRYYLASSMKGGFKLDLGSYGEDPKHRNPIFDSIGLTGLEFGDVFGVVDRLYLFARDEKDAHRYLMVDVSKKVDPQYRPAANHRVVNILEKDKYLFVNTANSARGRITIKEIREIDVEQSQSIARVSIQPPALRLAPGAMSETNFEERDPVEQDIKVGHMLSTEFQAYRVINIVAQRKIKVGGQQCRLVGWIEIDPVPLEPRMVTLKLEK